MVIDANLEPKIARQRDIAERQVALFTERYGQAMLDFACHAAFPQMLTTELVYLLRQLLSEQYELDLHWSAAPELLLSNLCDTAGHDLYGMSVGIRRVLLEKLVTQHGRKRLDELADWMGEYIKYRLERDFSSRARVFGDPSEWTVLACLKDDEIAAKIKEQLRQVLAETEPPYDRFQLSALVEDHADLLAQQGLQPFKLQDLAQRIEANNLDAPEPDNFIEFVQTMMSFNDFPLLQTKEIFYASISFEQTEIESGDALYPFEFETVQVDERGKIVHKEQGRAFAFKEPLAPDNWLEMVAIPSGKFMMGSPESEHDRDRNESPQHQVTIQPFFIGKYPVTQSQWRIIAKKPQIERKLNPEPSNFKGDNQPVEEVSWEEAVEFCQRLSQETGRNYRLPSEAEWEYACRAGTTTPFYFGKEITDKLANSDNDNRIIKRKAKSKQGTTSIDNFPPNAFGLYDMHGNVWEWCLDHWHGDYQDALIDGRAWLFNEDSNVNVLRGGSWYDSRHLCRSASRNLNSSNFRYNNIGFRVVCEIPRTL